MKAKPTDPSPFAPSPDPAEEDPQIHFTPVPRLRVRRDGWTPARQRMFIAALAGCGSVARAARAVGMTSRSAYRLMDADGADSFAAAWDEAIEAGIERVRIAALERALNGAPVAPPRVSGGYSVEKTPQLVPVSMTLATLGQAPEHSEAIACNRRTVRRERAVPGRPAAKPTGSTSRPPVTPLPSRPLTQINLRS